MTRENAHRDAALDGDAPPGSGQAPSRMTSPHSTSTSSSIAATAVPGAGSSPRRRHPVTLLWSVPGWRPFLRHAITDLRRAGGSVILGVDWTTARLWWRVHDPLARGAQRVLVEAAATALKTCQMCGAGRCWREPTTRLARSIIVTVAGPVRVRLCARCRMQLHDPADFLTALEAADVIAAQEGA